MTIEQLEQIITELDAGAWSRIIYPGDREMHTCRCCHGVNPDEAMTEKGRHLIDCYFDEDEKQIGHTDDCRIANLIEAVAMEIEEQESRCNDCGAVGENTYGPDPYAEEIYGDDTPVWLCDSCYHNRCMEI